LKLVYICAPYGAPTHEGMTENTRRACMLNLLAADLGYAPQVVHAGIHMGAYGSDADAATRRRGLEIDFAWIDAVAQLNGELWVLLTAALTLSSGSREEVGRFLTEAYSRTTRIKWFRWDDATDRPVETTMPEGLL